MTEKIYWGAAFLAAAGIIYTGIKWYHPVLTAFHVLVCGILVLVVLLQSGRAADLAGAFGGAGSQTAFGPRGAGTFLSNATTFLAVVFMLTSLGLAVSTSHPSGASVMEETPKPASEPESGKQSAPARPAPQTPPPAPTPAQPK